MLVAALVLAVVGCATPVGVREADPRDVHRELTRSALSSGEPSAWSLQELRRLGLEGRFLDEPEAALAELHWGLGASGEERRVFALAELSFLHAERTDSPAHYLAAAVYAWAFLFPDGAGQPPEPLSPRLRLAVDLYNRGLTEALSRGEGLVSLAPGARELPFGSVDLAFDPSELEYAGHRLRDFVPATHLAVHGLRNRYRKAGLGAPFAAGLERPEDAGLPPFLKLAVSALLRLEDARRTLIHGQLRGRLELYTRRQPETQVAGRAVPLEFETSAALAYSFDEPSIWRFELEGFRSGDPDVVPWARAREGLLQLRPHLPGRTPVVLVHGTASTPGRWADLINELENDPHLWERYELWLFVYNTGNPIPYSAGRLADALRRAVHELDPLAEDPALRRMVVVGHSQGGLLAKLTAVSSGTRFWDIVSERPMAELDLDDEQRALLRSSLFFEPLPFVERLVFIATPHRGSYLASLRLAGISLSALINRGIQLPVALLRLPVNLAALAADVVTDDDDARVRRAVDRIPTSLDNMTPGNPFLRALAELPIAGGVTAHSIIAVLPGEDSVETGSDGVVSYRSAQIDGVASQLVVRSGHSVQAEPETIEEVRRILFEAVSPD